MVNAILRDTGQHRGIIQFDLLYHLEEVLMIWLYSRVIRPHLQEEKDSH